MKISAVAQRRVLLLAAQAVAIGSLSGLSCYAPAVAQVNFDMLKQVYDAGDYHVAAKMAAEMVAAQPQNALAHYYLASALAKLGKTAEARQEYSKCVTLGRGTAIAANAAQALAGSTASAAGAAALPGGALAAKQRKQLLEQEKSEKERARRRFDDKVTQIQRECKLPDGTNNDSTLKARTKAAFEELSREEAAITQNFQKRADALFSTAKNQDEGTGSRIVPQGSNMYVQNFENLGDESQAVSIPTENPLEAKALRLGETPVTKKSKSHSRPIKQAGTHK